MSDSSTSRSAWGAMVKQMQTIDEVRVKRTAQVNLVKAIADAPPSPCEAHNCDRVEACKSEHLACDAFAVYAEMGTAYDPRDRLRIETKLVCKAKRRHVVRLVRTERPEPTAQTYRTAFAEEVLALTAR